MKFKSVPKGLLNFSFLSLKFSVFIFTPAARAIGPPSPARTLNAKCKMQNAKWDGGCGLPRPVCELASQ